MFGAKWLRKEAQVTGVFSHLVVLSLFISNSTPSFLRRCMLTKQCSGGFSIHHIAAFADLTMPASLIPVTHRAGVIWARGLGRVRLGVRTDMASVSRSLRRLILCVWDFSRGQRARRKERR